jgi:putative ABC transport system substrate-binding protein
MPAIYALRAFVASGGLAYYSSDWVDLYRRAASYIDRILKGAKPADLPVQQPTKFELARPRRRSASKFRRRCSHAPTR